MRRLHRFQLPLGEISRGGVFIAASAERRGDPGKAVRAEENIARYTAFAGGGAPCNGAPARLTSTGTPAAHVDESLEAALRRAMRGSSTAASRLPVPFAMGLQAGSLSETTFRSPGLSFSLRAKAAAAYNRSNVWFFRAKASGRFARFDPSASNSLAPLDLLRLDRF